MFPGCGRGRWTMRLPVPGSRNRTLLNDEPIALIQTVPGLTNAHPVPGRPPRCRHRGAASFSGTCWRLIEAQHRVSTLEARRYRRRIEGVLEDLIQDTKPVLPGRVRAPPLSLSTPFRYGAAYPVGSRFRRMEPDRKVSSTRPKNAHGSVTPGSCSIGCCSMPSRWARCGSERRGAG